MHFEEIVDDGKAEIASHLDHSSRLSFALSSKSCLKSLKRFVKTMKGSKFAEACASDGYFNILKWASDEGFPLSSRCEYRAAFNGDKAMLEYLHSHPKRSKFSPFFEKENDFEENSPSFALARFGSGDLMDWLRDNCPNDFSRHYAALGAAFYGHLALMELIIFDDFLDVDVGDLVRASIVGGQVEILRYLSITRNRRSIEINQRIVSRPFEFDFEDLEPLAGGSNVATMEWFETETKRVLDVSRMIYSAVASGKLDNLVYLLNYAADKNQELSISIILQTILENGHIHLAKYLFQSYPRSDFGLKQKHLKALVEYASSNSYIGGTVEKFLALLVLIYDKHKMKFDEDLVIELIRVHSVEIFEELKQNGIDFEITKYVLYEAATRLDLPLVDYFLELGCPTMPSDYDAVLTRTRRLNDLQREIIESLSKGGCVKEPSAYDSLIKQGSEETALDFLFSIGFPFDPSLYKTAVIFGNIPALDWLWNHKCVFNPNIIHTTNGEALAWIAAHSQN